MSIRFILVSLVAAALMIGCSEAASTRAPAPTVDLEATVDAAVEATRAVERTLEFTSEVTKRPLSTSTSTPVPTFVPTPLPYVADVGDVEAGIEKVYACLQTSEAYRLVFAEGVGIRHDAAEEMLELYLADKAVFVSTMLEGVDEDLSLALVFAVLGTQEHGLCGEFMPLPGGNAEGLPSEVELREFAGEFYDCFVSSQEFRSEVLSVGEFDTTEEELLSYLTFLGRDAAIEGRLSLEGEELSALTSEEIALMRIWLREMCGPGS